MRRRVAGNLLWMLAERGLQVSVGIGIVAMLARALGPESFAHFQYAQAIVTLAASVALICGSEVVVPRLVTQPASEAQHHLLAHAFALRAGAASLGYLLMCGYLWITHASTPTWAAALLLGTSILLREPSGVVSAWMQAHTNNRPGSIISMVALAAKTGLVALLFTAGTQSVPAFAGAFAVEPVIIALLLGAFYFSRMKLRRIRFDSGLARELFGGSVLFWASFMMMMGARRVDQLILQPLVPLVDYSAYAACMQILDNYTILATILASGIAPMYVYGKADAGQARANVYRTALVMTGLGLLGALLIAVCADWIVHLLYGSEFRSVAGLLRVAALASTLVFADVSLTLLPVYLRRPDWIAVKWALVLGMTVAFDLFAIPRFGVWGAIGGYALANTVAGLFGLFLCWRTGRTPRIHTIAKL